MAQPDNDTLVPPPHGRRRFLLRAGGLAAALAAFAAVGCAPRAPLRIAAQAWPGYAFLFMAGRAGLSAAGGVEIVETANLGKSAEALLAGQVDGAALTLDEVIRLLRRGMALKIVLILDISAGGDAVLARPEFAQPAALRGRRIGVEPSTLGAIMFARVLEAGGLQPADVERVGIDVDHVRAWESGGLDAIVSYDPYARALEDRGLARVFDSRAIPGQIVDVLAVRADALEPQQEALGALVRGHFLARADWMGRPFDSAFVLGDILGIRPDAVRGAMSGLDLPDAAFNRHLLHPPANDLMHTAAAIGGIMVRFGIIDSVPMLDGLFTPSFIPGDLG